MTDPAAKALFAAAADKRTQYLAVRTRVLAARAAARRPLQPAVQHRRDA